MALELKTNPYLDQRYVLCPANLKAIYLVQLLLDSKFRQVIIFTGSKKEARIIHRVLISLGFSEYESKMNPVLLYSGMSQKMRFASLEMFKALKSRILVTTDLANRGLDIPLVDLVINYNVPRVPITYVHRVGRTCRDPDFDEKDREAQSSCATSNDDQEYDVDEELEEEPGEEESEMTEIEDESQEEIEDGTPENNDGTEDEDNDGENDDDDDRDDVDDQGNDREEENDEETPKKDKVKKSSKPVSSPPNKYPAVRRKLQNVARIESKIPEVHKKFRGKSITLITQYDIRLIQSIEKFIGKKLTAEDAVNEKEIENIMKQVSLAVKEAEIAVDYEDQAMASGDLRTNNIYANSLIG